MIGLIIQALKHFDYDECGELMKVAKGKYSIPSNWKEIRRHVKERTNGRR